MKNEKEIRYFSMFTGVGGFELGFEKARRFRQEEELSKQGSGSISSESNKRQYTPIGFSETDKYASELLKNKFPDIKNYGDATKINPEELPDFDLLVGGFPCQAFSIAGKRKGFEDTRGTLFYEIARILKVKRPRNILLENVKGLLSHDSGRTFGTIISTLSELGYVVQWMVLNSKFFGVPQNRERVFIIGSLRGERIPEILPLGQISSEYNGEIKTMINTGHDANSVHSTEGISTTLKGLGGGQGAKTGLYAMRKAERNIPKAEREYDGQQLELQKDDCSNALSSVQKDNLWVEDMKIRRLTPIECERLQGFPDNWTEGFSDTQRYKMMGNAVTVNVIKALAQKLQ